jgi:hypothetical protein
MYSFGVDIAITLATEVSSRSSSFWKWRQHFPILMDENAEVPHLDYAAALFFRTR